MTNPDIRMEIAVDGHDNIIAFQPPINNALRQLINERLEPSLLEHIAARASFETMHSTDGTPYSELRADLDVVKATHKSLGHLAGLCKTVLEEQGYTVEADLTLRSPRDGQRPFDSRRNS
jgi:hypothetical protein